MLMTADDDVDVTREPVEELKPVAVVVPEKNNDEVDENRGEEELADIVVEFMRLAPLVDIDEPDVREGEGEEFAVLLSRLELNDAGEFELWDTGIEDDDVDDVRGVVDRLVERVLEVLDVALVCDSDPLETKDVCVFAWDDEAACDDDTVCDEVCNVECDVEERTGELCAEAEDERVRVL